MHMIHLPCLATWPLYLFFSVLIVISVIHYQSCMYKYSHMNISLNIRFDIEIKYKNLRIKFLIFSLSNYKSTFFCGERGGVLILRILDVPENIRQCILRAKKVALPKNAMGMEEGALQWAFMAGIDLDSDEREEPGKE